ncbi:hypothetical protein F5Y12DRAFT_799575 [Xylaria sp. FL1777]|nr:hypothetical protein F5Y12DRAFT_799575 [Xylaria sp. FL1777]
MTKPWELHEATIKKLYAENTLAVVRKTMIERYNFKASTRAYRGRLIKWGVRKYNCRRRGDGGSISAGSPDGSVSGSDTASPTLSQPTIETTPDFPEYSSSGQMRDSQPRMSNLLGQSYDTASMGSPRAYTESYGRNRALLSPTQEVQGWHSSPTQSGSPSTSFAHANTAATSGHMYAYQPLSPAASTYSSSLAYESDPTNCDRRQSFPQTQARQYSTGTNHGDSTYFPVRGSYGHGHGHRSAGMGSYDSSCDHVTRHNSTS